MTLLIAIASFGIFSIFAAVHQAALYTLVVFGITGFTEHVYRKAKAGFKKRSQLFEALQCNDSETFVKLACKVYGVGNWNPEIKDIPLGGFIFRRVTSDRPVPLCAVAGPLCPDCKKPLDYRAPPLFPWAVRFDCLCGFSSIKLKHPQLLYQKVRRYFNLP